MSKSARISAARAHAGRDEESELVTSFNVDWRGYKKSEVRSLKSEDGVTDSEFPPSDFVSDFRLQTSSL
jgi:hypothetical protein